MTPEDMRSRCNAAIKDAEFHGVLPGIVLVVSGKMPKGFPRGELLCESSSRERVRRYDPRKLLAWLDQQEGR